MKQSSSLPKVPLAERARPKELNDFVGQEHLVGPGKPIERMVNQNVLSSFIMWGSPGTGKTTLAKIIAHKTDADFFQLNAISSGVKDIRDVIAKAQENSNKKTLLFIDEIHRFNKSQQDALLGAVESGTIVLIGATTENPSFEVIPALRSRMRIYKLNDLSESDIILIVKGALLKDVFLSSLPPIQLDYDYLAYLSGGDARTALNILESGVIQELESENIVVDKAVIENVLQSKNFLYDKGGEEHYNIISAFIKSMRGSDPDAALYWLARMISGGEDPLFIARRMVVFASEDVGNASPNALVLAQATFQAVHTVGYPEARIILGQCTTYLASQPKSNASYLGIDEAMALVEKNPAYPVPLHLRNAPTSYMKNIGYGSGYKYPHSFPNHFVMEQYLPTEIKDKQFYKPTANGQEKNLLERLSFLWKGKKHYEG